MTTAPATSASLDQTSFRTTEIAQAERFVRQNRDDFRWCPPAKNWLYWSPIENRWVWDEREVAKRQAREAVVELFREGVNQNSEEKKKTAIRMGDKHKVEAILHLARADLAVLPHELDSDTWLFHTRNVTLDLRSGEALTPAKTNLITRIADFEYDPDAECPRWQDFLTTIFGGDREVISYVQRAIGYSLTGETTEQCLFLCVGAGRNGKTRFANVLRDLLGDYLTVTPFATFQRQDGRSSTNDLAALNGARVILASEGTEGQKLDEDRIKSITGDDPVTARFLYKEFFTFTPIGKPWLFTNHQPTITGTDEGIWRRIRYIPFRVSIPLDQVDKNLQEKLRAELPGILNWALQGLEDWRARGGLDEPDVVTSATDEYRHTQDLVSAFLDECCEIGPGQWTAQKDLFETWQAWNKAHGRERPWTETVFSTRLKQRAEARGTFSSKRTSKARGWESLGLKADAVRLRAPF